MRRDEYLADIPIFSLVDLNGLPRRGTLEGASGFKSTPGPYQTVLIERAEMAWRTPFAELSCEQVRLLVSQKMGLEWVGRPAIEFSARYTGATITNYPGEMAVLCIRAADHLARVAEPEFSIWVGGDFGWIDEVLDWDPKLREQVRGELASARELVA